MTVLAWGSKVSPEFARKVIAIARRQRYDPSWLMACMAFEAAETFSPRKQNKQPPHATGLIQFMPKTAASMGTSIPALMAMTAEEQLDWVEAYLQPYVGRIRTIDDLYMTILWPAAVGKPSGYVIFKAPSRAYTDNRGLDINHDDAVTKAEAAHQVQLKLQKGMQPGYRLDIPDYPDDAAQDVAQDSQDVTEPEPYVPPMPAPRPSGLRWRVGVAYPELREAAVRLRARGYAAGMYDGKWGGALAGAIKAYKNDRALTGPVDVDQELLDDLSAAESDVTVDRPDGWMRPVAVARKEATDETIAQYAPEMKPVAQASKTSLLSVIVGFFGTVLAGIMSAFKEAWEWVTSIGVSLDRVPGYIWVGGVTIVAFVIWWKTSDGAEKLRKSFKTGERV